MNKIIVGGGKVHHLTRNMTETLCGRSLVRTGMLDHEIGDTACCKRCAAAEAKTSAERDRNAYYAQVAETQDAAMSQAVPVKPITMVPASKLVPGMAIANGYDPDMIVIRTEPAGNEGSQVSTRVHFTVGGKTRSDVWSEPGWGDMPVRTASIPAEPTPDAREDYDTYARWCVGRPMSRAAYEQHGCRIAADQAAGKLSTNPYEWGKDMDAIKAGLHKVDAGPVMVHYGESRPLCGARLAENDRCVTSVNEITCVTCWDGVVRPVDLDVTDGHLTADQSYTVSEHVRSNGDRFAPGVRVHVDNHPSIVGVVQFCYMSAVTDSGVRVPMVMVRRSNGKIMRTRIQGLRIIPEGGCPCSECRALAQREGAPFNEYKIEITRHVVSYYAPDDHSQCEHRFNQDENGECDSVGGRWLDGGSREISPAETETILWEPEYDEETYDGIGRESLAQWVRDRIDSLGYFEASTYPIGHSLPASAWLSAKAGDNYTEDVTEISVRLTDGWSDTDRAFAFSYILGCR